MSGARYVCLSASLCALPRGRASWNQGGCQALVLLEPVSMPRPFPGWLLGPGVRVPIESLVLSHGGCRDQGCGCLLKPSSFPRVAVGTRGAGAC
jgi:hypothetical protein